MRMGMIRQPMCRLLDARRWTHSLPTSSRITLPYTQSFSSTSKSNQPETDGELQEILRHFNAPIRFAFGYGSGVFEQKDNGQGNQPKPLVDLVFGVTHPEHWHSLNIRQHRHHYSSLANLGSTMVASIQDSMGAGIYYNPFVEVNGMKVKYGVISMDRLLNDMRDWETLYVAGRMHKPINVLRTESRVKLALSTNRYNAVRAALFMLPSEFTEEDLFLAITGISYTGDFRMTFGENPRKIYNIVHSQMAEFREIYKPIIDDLPAVNYTAMGNIAQEDNIKIRGSMLQKLPKILQDKIHYHHRWYLNRTNQARGVATAEPHFSQSVVNSPEVGEYIRKGIAEIIRKPAIIQAVKGVLSAGIGRSVKYGLQKISKMRDGRRAS